MGDRYNVEVSLLTFFLFSLMGGTRRKSSPWRVFGILIQLVRQPDVLMFHRYRHTLVEYSRSHHKLAYLCIFRLPTLKIRSVETLLPSS
jgi:hypothetical protein